MNQQFTAGQWKLAEAPVIEAIGAAQRCSRVVMQMLQTWDEIQALDDSRMLLARASRQPGEKL